MTGEQRCPMCGQRNSLAVIEAAYEKFARALKETVDFFSDPDNYIDPEDCPAPRRDDKGKGETP